MAGRCQDFIDWFQKKGGTVDLESVALTEFPASDGGRGLVALKDIEEGHILFSIPRVVTLSTRTASLPTLFGLEGWQEFGLHEGWSGLILSMMWEVAQGPKSKWAGYFDILPSSFDTPMFWDESDLEELRGTSVVQKLGKEDAVKDYQNKIEPAIKSRPDIFLPSDHETHYSFHTYHIMGSRILSRSFNVEKWQDDVEEGHQADGSLGSAMDIDERDTNTTESHSHAHDADGHDEEDSDSEEDQSYLSDTAMVPMADMLNARYEHANASLFYEKEALNMVSTQFIKAGDQIWNTYSDLPNSELLRRYGHVDWLPLENGSQGNPGDVVEMPATIIVAAVKENCPTMSEGALSERIDYWLEEGGDDIFDFDWAVEYPLEIFSLIRLLSLSDAEWKKTQGKGKLPKSKPDGEVLTVLQNAIQCRLNEYSTSIQVDESLLQMDALSLNRRNAIIVRLGEKKILDAILSKAKAENAEFTGKSAKRKPELQVEAGGRKKSRR